VSSSYKKEVNIKIQGTGVGGCDVLLETGETNPSDCWCLWGTINYSFCVYSAGIGDNISNSSAASYGIVNQGKCPVITGESLVCSDLSSLGNCYDGAYSCTVDSSGLCHCESI
jgi:hypothetical protein